MPHAVASRRSIDSQLPGNAAGDVDRNAPGVAPTVPRELSPQHQPEPLARRPQVVAPELTRSDHGPSAGPTEIDVVLVPVVVTAIRSVTCTVKLLFVPGTVAAVGVPLTTPVRPSRVSPAGSEPDVSDQVTPDRPAVVVNANE